MKTKPLRCDSPVDSAYGSAPTSPTWSRHEPLFSGVVMEAITASLRSIDAESMMAKLSSNTNQPESSVPKEDRGSVLDGNGLSSFGISRDSTSCPVVTIIEFGNGTASNSPTISSSASTTSSSILISRSGSPGYNPKSPATRLNSAHMERKSQQPSVIPCPDRVCEIVFGCMILYSVAVLVPWVLGNIISIANEWQGFQNSFINLWKPVRDIGVACVSILCILVCGASFGREWVIDNMFGC